MSDLQSLTKQILAFRNARDWSQFHNPKDLAIAISVEANELMEAFLWKEPHEASKEKLEEELADIITYALLFAHETGIDINNAVLIKLGKNELKYPVDKSKGSAKKYDEL